MNSMSLDHQDALQELMNVAMGRAARELAILLGLPVTLSIPSVRRATDAELLAIQQAHSDSYFVRQPFDGDAVGEVISVLSRSGCIDVARLLRGEDQAPDDLSEALLASAGILSGASLQGFLQSLSIDTTLGSPLLVDPSTEPAWLTHDWGLALLIEIAFEVQNLAFTSKTLICMADEGLERVLHQVDELLQA
ncbi:hypothetical protein ACFOSD_15475 [Salinispirillum marinum]|uniref:CheC-like protein domain-containing protein n=2 Tax=Saccharospirillaceae TaxID=255527 RepID=A0ABV8BH78_9GAMM